MRIAVLVIGVPLALLIFLQGCTMGALENAGDEKDPIGGWGVIVGFTFLVGSGLVLSFPLASAVIFGLSALVAFAVAAGTVYGDMWIWGSFALVLGAMSFVAWIGKRRAAKRVSVVSAQPFPQFAQCPICGHAVHPLAPKCPTCGYVPPQVPVGTHYP